MANECNHPCLSTPPPHPTSAAAAAAAAVYTQRHSCVLWMLMSSAWCSLVSSAMMTNIRASHILYTPKLCPSIVWWHQQILHSHWQTLKPHLHKPELSRVSYWAWLQRFSVQDSLRRVNGNERDCIIMEGLCGNSAGFIWEITKVLNVPFKSITLKQEMSITVVRKWTLQKSQRIQCYN